MRPLVFTILFLLALEVAVMAAEAEWLVPRNPAPGLVTFERSFDLPASDQVLLRLAALDNYRAFLNGAPLAADDTPQYSETFDVTKLVKEDGNHLRIEAFRDVKPDRNSWLNLYVGLETPFSGTKLTFTTRGALYNEWLYLEVEDDTGNTSGYFAQESGHGDFILGNSGEAIKHEVDLTDGSVIELTRKGQVDFARIKRITFRVDQKDAWAYPSGAFEVGDIWLEGPDGKLEVAPINRWQLVEGHGEIGGKTLGYTEGGFVRATWSFGSPAALAARLVAFSEGKPVAEIVTDSDWLVNGLAPATRPEPKNVINWIDMRAPKQDSRLARPAQALARVLLDFEGDRLEVGKPVTGQVRVWSFGEAQTALLRALNWQDEVVAEQQVPLAPEGEFASGPFRLEGLPIGLYRLEAEVEGSDQPQRFTALGVLPEGETRLSALFNTLSPLPDRPGRQGLNSTYEDHAALLLAIKQLGVDCVVMHIHPEFFASPEFPDLLAFCEATGLHFALNNEFANWAPAPQTWKEGEPNPLSAEGGCHRWDLPAEALEQCAATGLFDGVVYDEGEHMQLCRNYYSRLADPVHRKPYLVETTGMTLQEAYEAFWMAAEGVREYNEAHGARMLVESVFPVLWHPLARAGVTLCPKLLKEDIHPVVLAQALGAALEYDAELWFSPDFWFWDRQPGHTPEEYERALQMAWKAGVDDVYTEHQMVLARLSNPFGDITPWGEVLQEHIKALPEPSTRGYTYKDFEPEVAIVRFPDSDWGQAASSYWNTLYGAENLQSTPNTREWLKVWNLLSGGAINAQCVNYNSPLYKEWYSHFPSPSVAIYDHLVGYAPLKSAKWLFVCGEGPLSAETLRALDQKVTEGAICFIPHRLIPEVFLQHAPEVPGRAQDGKGWWVLLDGYEDEQLAPYRDLLPPVPDGMQLHFKGGVEVEFTEGMAPR